MISKKNKGFSLAEVIVSMVIIVIISISAISVINFSLNSGRKNAVSNFFEVETENYIKAYCLGSDSYEKSLKLLTGEDYDFGTDLTIKYNNKFEITQDDDYDYSVKLTFIDSTFNVSCYDKSNNLIYSAEV